MGAKILIVDDITENLKIMVSVFEEHMPHLEIFQSNNPIKAIEIAQLMEPNLIITDWDMPGLDGLQLIEKLKKDKRTYDIPIIMATAVMLSAEDLKRALDCGAVDYLRKPIEPIELIARTNSALLIKKYYTQILEQKDKELTESSLNLISVTEQNKNLTSQLCTIKNLLPNDVQKAKSKLDKLVKNLTEQNNQKEWQKFNLNFSKVHKDFEKNIINVHAKLTPAEIKLCTLIRLGMANKEIASVLNQSPNSIKVSSYRLRKKLNLEGDVNLRTYLTNF